MNTVQEQWELFLDQVVPPNATEIQVIEMRRSFYAGVGAMLRIQRNIHNSTASKEAKIVMLEEICDECVQFASNVIKGIS